MCPIFFFFQGEIGEKGQKVIKAFIHNQVLIYLVFENLKLFLFSFAQGEPGIGHRGPEGQAGPPGQKVTFDLLDIKELKEETLTLGLIYSAPSKLIGPCSFSHVVHAD